MSMASKTLLKTAKLALKIYTTSGFHQACLGLKPPAGVLSHITGTDLVKDKDNSWYVLENNLRSPFKVSYMLENRRVIKSTFPEIFQNMMVKPVDDYPSQLLETLFN